MNNPQEIYIYIKYMWEIKNDKIYIFLFTEKNHWYIIYKTKCNVKNIKIKLKILKTIFIKY